VIYFLKLSFELLVAVCVYVLCERTFSSVNWWKAERMLRCRSRQAGSWDAGSCHFFW